MGLIKDLREALPSRGEAVALREQANTANIQADYFKESLTRLELSMEDEGWRRMAFDAKREFTRGGLDDIIELSRVMYIIHPLIQRAVDVTTFYTWAQGGVSKALEDKVQQEIVEPQMADDGNRAELYSHQARLLTQVDQMCDGSVFMRLPTNALGEVSVRSIPTEEIRDIHTKPGDRQQIWYYRRVWVETTFNPRRGTTEQKQHEALYPDWRYNPKSKPNTIGRTDVMWDEPIMHRRTGGLKQMQFGIPSTYSALDWAKAYKKFLEDWHTLVHSLSRFAWEKTAKGQRLRATKEKLEAESSKKKNDPREPSQRGERGPVGAVHVTTDGEGLTPINKSGATTSAEDAKPSRQMVGSATNIPDTILSQDPQQGALATAKTLDRPTELYMMNWQKLEQDWDADLFRYTYDARVRRGRMPGRVIDTLDGCTKVEPGLDPTVQLTFPPILERDQESLIKTIVAAATLEGKEDAGTIPREQLSEMLLEGLGVEDVEDVLSELDTEELTAVETAVESLREAALALKKEAT